MKRCSMWRLLSNPLVCLCCKMTVSKCKPLKSSQYCAQGNTGAKGLMLALVLTVSISSLQPEKSVYDSVKKRNLYSPLHWVILPVVVCWELSAFPYAYMKRLYVLSSKYPPGIEHNRHQWHQKWHWVSHTQHKNGGAGMELEKQLALKAGRIYRSKAALTVCPVWDLQIRCIGENEMSWLSLTSGPVWTKVMLSFIMLLLCYLLVIWSHFKHRVT